MNKLFFLINFSNKTFSHFVFVTIYLIIEKQVHYNTVFIALLIVAILTYVFNLLQILLINKRIKLLADILLDQLRELSIDYKVDSKNIYNKVNSIIENPFCYEEIICSILSTIFVFFAYFVIFRYQIIFIIIMAVLVIPIVYLLNLATEKIFLKVIQATERRNTVISDIIKFRFSLVGNAFLLKQAIDNFLNITNHEKKYRLLDSGFKTLETYLSIFYKYIPYLIALLSIHFISLKINIDSKLYWLSIPILASMLTLPRQYINVKEYENGIDYLKINLKEQINSDTTILFDDKDILWKTSLINNITYYDDYILVILKELNLWYELNLSNNSEPLKILIDPDKLSEGQKQRLLLVRAICLAKKSETDLVIKSSFQKLDNVNILKVHKILNQIDQNKYIKIKFNLNMTIIDVKSKNNVNTLTENISIDINDNKNYTKKSHNKFKHILVAIYTFFIFFIAASIDCYVASLLNSTFKSSNASKYILLLSFFSFILVFSVGAFLENFIRNICFKNIENSLNTPYSENEEIKKVVSVDLNIMIEDFSFYIHDFLWISSLFLLSIIVMNLFLGKFGSYLSMCLIFLIFIIYLIGYKRIIQCRDDFISRSKYLVETFNNLISFDKIWSSVLKKDIYREIKGELMLHNMFSWIKSKYQLNNSKIFLSSNLQFISSLAIAITIYISGLMNQNIAIISGILTTLLAVQSESLRFFVSLSGVISTSNSADNILKLNSNNSFESLNIEYSHDNILINSYKSNKTGIKYKKFNYYKGINIVSGASGSGKTTYFLDILKKLFSSNIQCHYITYDFFKEQMNTIGSFENTILFLLKDITVQKIPNVVIYDEITNVVSSCNLNEALEFLNLLAIQTGTVVMLSDHRIFEGTSKYKLHRLSNDKD